MRNFYLVKGVFVVLLLLGCSTTWAQTSRITGRVIASDDQTGLPGVSILEKGTNNGTVTDAEGNYSITVPQNAVLVFSFVGYATREISVEGRTTIDISMETDVMALGEVVVIGYGQQEKKDVTGSLTSISTKDFNKGVLTSPQDLLVGRVAGVSVISNSGAPGAGSTIRIRAGSSLNASNDPLIVIDGFPVDNNGIGGTANPLAAINPNDIESFVVLKDASATAIYGSRASNGVIIITTKKGSSGKPTIQYNGTLSVSMLAKKVEVLTGDEYREYINTKVDEGSVSGLGASALTRLGPENTDWQEEIYRTAISHDHNVSVSGTYGILPYRVSYGYTKQEGILRNTDVSRNSINISLTPSFFDGSLNVSANLKSSFSKNNFGSEGAVGSAVTYDPTQPVMNGNTKYGGYFTWTQLSSDLPGGIMDPDGEATQLAPANPVALIEQTDNRAEVDRHIGNLQLDYRFKFLPDLKVNVNAGFDIIKTEGYNIRPVNAAFTLRDGPGLNDIYSAENRSELFDIYFNYTKSFGVHKLEATAGYSFQSFTRNGQSFRTRGDGSVIYGDDTNDDDVLDAPLKDIPNPTDLLSIFGRINYSIADKYLLTLTLRNDNSSRFIKEHRSGLFPAASFGWRISDEEFLAAVPAISNLKLRISYGITGQQDIGSNPYPYLPRFQQSTSTAQYQFGDQFYYTYRPAPYDAKIKWEETSTFNVGLDFGLLEEKISGTFDVFSRETKDLIGSVPVPAGSNFSNFLTTNVGDMKITGYEIGLNYNPVRTADVDVNFGVNFTRLNSEITKLTKTDDPDFFVSTGGISGGVGNNIQRHIVGEAPFTFFTFQQVYDANGMPIEGLYVDRTGLGGSVISNENNKYYHEKPMADYLIGINSRINYKKVDFSFSGRVSLGNYVYNNVLSANAVNNQLYNQNGFFSNVPVAIKESNFNAQQYWSDFYVEDASFFKMDNISLGYTFDNLVNDKLKIRLSTTVQNAFVITDYSGIDPEHSNGIDNNLYPRPRTFLFGLNITY